MPVSRLLSMRGLLAPWWKATLVLVAACAAGSCVQGQRAADTGDPGFPFGPSAVGVQPIAYVQDIKPIFDRDCASCHGVRESAGHYSVRTYADTIAGQRPGDASSSVVVDCSPGGSMYRYFSGDAVSEATMVFRWMVYYNAQQTR
jgi:mono/diheme cytochrome c family protein